MTCKKVFIESDVDFQLRDHQKSTAGSLVIYGKLFIEPDVDFQLRVSSEVDFRKFGHMFSSLKNSTFGRLLNLFFFKSTFLGLE